MKMLKINLPLLLFYFISNFGYAQLSSKSFDHKDFNKIKVSGNFNVIVKKGDVFKITVTGEKRDIDEVISDLKNAELTISYERKALRTKRTNIEIILPKLQAVNFEGSTRANIEAGFKIDYFNVYSSGSTELNVEMEAQKIYLDLSGNSTLSIKGKGEDLQANISGASLLNAFDLLVEDAKLEVSGTSGVRISVSNSLTANASGTAKVRYKGSPSQMQNNARGFSSIKKEGL